MKSILTGIAILVLILTIIDFLRKKSRSTRKMDTGWIKVGLLLSGVSLVSLIAYSFLHPSKALYAKMIVPTIFLIVFLDLFRKYK